MLGPTTIRRDQRFTLLLVTTGIFFLLAILLYNGTHVATFVRTKQWSQDETWIKDQVFPGGGTVPVPASSQRQKNTLASTMEETVIPSVVLSDGVTPQRAHVPGFTLLDKVYLRNGTFYIVTSDPDFPPRKLLLSKPVELGQGEKMLATDQEMRIILPSEAPEILGDFAVRISGFTVFLYDHSQFMHHYYHWWGEIIIGMWRVYSTLNLKSSSTGRKAEDLPFPARFIMPAVPGNEWRDRAGVTGPLMAAAFPDAAIEKMDYWNDLKKLDTTVVFERSMIVNRDVAGLHPFGTVWFKMIAGTMALNAPDYYWEPIRNSLVRNMIGYVPSIDSKGRIVKASLRPFGSGRAVINNNGNGKNNANASFDDNDDEEGGEGEAQGEYDLPVVTYISRQGAGRRLRNEDHVKLVDVLKRLEEEGLCRLEIPTMEKLSIKEQVAVIARTTILVGVHGNGLTHQLFMPPSLRSATFEIFFPPSYTFDYEILARNMGHKHYGVHNDTLVTFPKGEYHKGVKFVDGFHGNSIPVYGPTIADEIRKRLTQPDEAVED